MAARTAPEALPDGPPGTVRIVPWQGSGTVESALQSAPRNGRFGAVASPRPPDPAVALPGLPVTLGDATRFVRPALPVDKLA